jgi:hypothetical protein
VHDLRAAAIGHADLHDELDAVGDLCEIRRIKSSALGIQRWLRGTVAAMSIPSAALQDAIACTVCRWL